MVIQIFVTIIEFCVIFVFGLCFVGNGANLQAWFGVNGRTVIVLPLPVAWSLALDIPLLPTAKFKTGTHLKSVFLINRIGVVTVTAILYKVESSNENHCIALYEVTTKYEVS
ncbi:hypothetical protein FRACYDRAFT_236724 [Fragilariopsis cylindrus CCMP1102]|uniref:Uncharacterized protein n=1 Tax=Fragilariopsis cylindrus CCMP1102 TaxID=635003 RepID=A0A1E7FJW5_9STRA|nr:hypothetical protein FRACYDRAFT_236724 [Fragilariopsis cylindrus CCMP1102]|eukprot:OEU18448.1 hypothetical protein FRACYDRAFT_236724 [Fragilariopsis cylindrus CCMP1102]